MKVRYSYLIPTILGSILFQACSSVGSNIDFKDPVEVSQTYMEALANGQVDVVRQIQHNTTFGGKDTFDIFVEGLVEQNHKAFQSQNGITNITVTDQVIQDDRAEISLCLKTGNEPSGDPREMESAYRLFNIGYNVSLISERNKWKVLQASNMSGFDNCSS